MRLQISTKAIMKSGKSALRKRARKRRASLGTARPTSADDHFITGPKLRAKLGISAVTLWRWRHDEQTAFPKPKSINGRLYFPAGAISDWLARQPETA
jgi:predicted DNA-binding transcriptional regulator AlpA